MRSIPISTAIEERSTFLSVPMEVYNHFYLLFIMSVTDLFFNVIDLGV